jgi:hypothetical protein
MLNNANTATATFDSLVLDCEAVLTFQLIVTDSCGATATDTVVITVGGPCCE